MAYITCKKCGTTYDYPEGETPTKCISCDAPIFSFNGHPAGAKPMNQMTRPNFILSNGTEITGVKISVKDFFFLYLNGLIAAIPFFAVILIFYLIYLMYHTLTRQI